ncbi:MAG TPA: hypothetical protein DD730_00905 [Desulfosporosinus sp.]|nr:hypothetical protein [Desulfosporosinus sp.]
MRVALLGDSITEGIGSKKINYLTPLHKILQDHNYAAEIRNFASSGTTIKYANHIFNEIVEFNPDIVIVMYGSVDAQIRPNIDLNRFHLKLITPNRYKSVGGMLDPRAFYSKRKLKALPQIIDNIYRKIWKKMIVITSGTYQKLSCNIFEVQYREFLKKLQEKSNTVICLSTIYIDDSYFLGSSIEYRKFNKVVKQLSEEFNRSFVDLYSRFESRVKNEDWNSIYYLDHFHPNKEGLKMIADSIFNEILQVDHEI